MAIADLLAARLNAVSGNGADDDVPDLFGGGVRKEWSVRITDVIAEVMIDETYKNMRIEHSILRGKWSSHVRKDEYAAFICIDHKWGIHANPSGNFSVDLNVLNGGIAGDVNVQFEAGNDDDPNNFAREQAEALVRSEIDRFVRR